MTECSHCRKRYDNGVRFCPVDGYAVVPVAEPLLGRTLAGQFQIQAVCGHGATGTVYRAIQVGIDREVAVKILRADLLKDADVIKRFLREARAGARLSHPNIATVHTVGQTEEGVPFLVMEYVEGVPLSGLLGVGKPLPLRRIVHIGAQIASALAEAHGQGIVHRDLKPENILLSEKRGESDVVKVVDFGIAKMVVHVAPGEDPISRMGTVFGTPHYIAPEQASGQPVDGRADIYSLGCILFQMATGKVPFDGQQGLQVLLRQVRDPVPDPRSLNPRITDGLAELILKMLAKDPAGRPQSATLLIASLRALVEEGGGDATATGTTGRPAAKATGRARVSAGSPRKGDARSRSDEGEWFQPGEAAGAAAADEADEDAPVRKKPTTGKDARAAAQSDESLPPDDEDSDDNDTEERDEAEAEGRQTAAERGHRASPASGRAARPASGRAASGRPARAASPRAPQDSDDAFAAPPPFWRQHWRQLIGIGGAIAIGVLVGLLYAYSRERAPVPPPATLPGPAAPPTTAPINLIRSSPSPARPTPARPTIGASPAAPTGPVVKPADNKAAPSGPPAPAGPSAATPAAAVLPAPAAPAAVPPAVTPGGAAPGPAPAPTVIVPPAATPPAAPVPTEVKPEAKPEVKPEAKPESPASPTEAAASNKAPAKAPEKTPEPPAPPATPPAEEGDDNSDPYRRLR